MRKGPKLGELITAVRRSSLCPVQVCAHMATKKADHRAIVYLPSSTRRELKRIAQREGRSVSSPLRQLALERVPLRRRASADGAELRPSQIDPRSV